MYQLLKNSDGSGVAEVSLVPVRGDENVAAIANIMTPLGTLLRQGLVLAVDENEPIVYPFTVCSQQGCLARFGVKNELLEQMKSGSTAIVEIVAAVSPDRPIVLDVSLSGFTRGFDTLLEQDSKRPQQ
jgi:invasion protein IalB